MENAAGLEGAWQPRLQCVGEWAGPGASGEAVRQEEGP